MSGVITCTGNNMIIIIIIIIIPEGVSLLSDTETCSWRLHQFKRKTHQSGRRTIDVTAATSSVEVMEIQKKIKLRILRTKQFVCE